MKKVNSTSTKWVCINGNQIDYTSIGDTKKESKEYFMQSFGGHLSFKDLYQNGWQCIKVKLTITEI